MTIRERLLKDLTSKFNQIKGFAQVTHIDQQIQKAECRALSIYNYTQRLSVRHLNKQYAGYGAQASRVTQTNFYPTNISCTIKELDGRGAIITLNRQNGSFINYQPIE